MKDLPVTLGLCRTCARRRDMVETTIEGHVLRRIYYCRAKRRTVDGAASCNDYMEDKE